MSLTFCAMPPSFSEEEEDNANLSSRPRRSPLRRQPCRRSDVSTSASCRRSICAYMSGNAAKGPPQGIVVGPVTTAPDGPSNRSPPNPCTEPGSR